MPDSWPDAAPRNVGLLASNGEHWRPHLVGPDADADADVVAEVVLVHWGAMAPFDLQLLARILEEAVLRGGRRALAVDHRDQRPLDHLRRRLRRR